MLQHISIAVPQTNTFTWRLGIRLLPEQPRFIILALQTDKMEDQSCISTIYDNCNLSSTHVLLNDDWYILDDFETNFAQNNLDHFYSDFVSGFQETVFHFLL